MSKGAQILLRAQPPMAQRIAKAAAAKGVTRQELILGVLDGVLPAARAARSAFDVPLPGFPEQVPE